MARRGLALGDDRPLFLPLPERRAGRYRLPDGFPGLGSSIRRSTSASSGTPAGSTSDGAVLSTISARPPSSGGESRDLHRRGLPDRQVPEDAPPFPHLLPPPVQQLDEPAPRHDPRAFWITIRSLQIAFTILLVYANRPPSPEDRQAQEGGLKSCRKSCGTRHS